MVWFKNLPRDLPNFGVHLVEHKTGFGGGLEVKCESQTLTQILGVIKVNPLATNDLIFSLKLKIYVYFKQRDVRA